MKIINNKSNVNFLIWKRIYFKFKWNKKLILFFKNLRFCYWDPLEIHYEKRNTPVDLFSLLLSYSFLRFLALSLWLCCLHWTYKLPAPILPATRQWNLFPQLLLEWSRATNILRFRTSGKFFNLSTRDLLTEWSYNGVPIKRRLE